MKVLKGANQRSRDISHRLFHPCLQSLKSQLDERASVEQLQARSSSARRHRACRAELLPCEDVILLVGTVLGTVSYAHTWFLCALVLRPIKHHADGATRFVNRHIVYVATSSAEVSAVFWWRIPALCLSALHCLLVVSEEHVFYHLKAAEEKDGLYV